MAQYNFGAGGLYVNGIPMNAGAGLLGGLGCGNIYYLVTAKATATNLYYKRLVENGVKGSDICTTLAAAYAKTTANQNDVIVVTPGAYLETAELAWSKGNTHLVGLGGPNTGGDWSEPGVVIYTTGVGVASVITVTGANCQFYNFTVSNYGANAACLTAFTLNKYGCYFKNVTFQGMMTTGPDATVAAAALYIDGDGMYPIFDCCTIGQNVWDTRTGALSGVLRFTNTAGTGPQNGKFRNCDFLSCSETATCAMVAIPINYAIGRGWKFDNCHFENFSVNWAVNLNQVFYDNCGTTHSIMLHHCTAIGIDEWQDADQGNNYIGADMPIVGLGGGLARNPTAVVGT